MKKSISFIKFITLILALAFVVPVWGQVAIPTTPNSVLQDGVVYNVNTSQTITATTAGQSGLQVAQGAKVVINIKTGATLTVTGANADASKGFAGMPGILVPETSTLVIIGEGALVANGGAGTNGLDGQNGQNARGENSSSKNPFTYSYEKNKNFGGYGGAGGDGGYGAGAGIGGAGGKGGAGGAQTAPGANATSYNGAAGNAGSAGSLSGGMGKVYVLGKVTVTANAGVGGTKAGSAGTNGISGYTTEKDSGYFYSLGGGGAGGGGAAGDAPTYAFGAGGTGGGGGGSGGQGGADRNNNYAADAKAVGKDGNLLNGGTAFGTVAPAMNRDQAICTAASGNGGLGTKNGISATGTRDSGAGRTAKFKILYFDVATNIQHYPNTGGIGGAAGAQGGTGADGNVYKLNTATITQNTTSAAKNLQTYTSESQIPTEIRKLYEVALSFDNQGGSVARADEILVKGESIKNLTSFSIPTKDDFYFEGYFTEAEGGEKIYDHSGNAVDVTRTFTANSTLYAHWIDTKFTIVWDYSYIDKDGNRKVVKDEDKSLSAKVKFNATDEITVPAGSVTTGTGNYAGHTIATATITAVVGSDTNSATTVYVTEDQLKTLTVTAKAILAEENKYVTTNVSSHEALMSAVPEGTYNQPWSITITNGIKPDVVNVKLLSSTSEDGTYTVISQMENLSVACDNNEGVYSGTYPVWPDNMSYTKLYYKAQIVGYEIDGVAHKVANMPATETISSEADQQTLSQSIALPIVHLDLNAPTGTSPHYASGTTEYKYAGTYRETIALGGYAAELQDYKFNGWTMVEGGEETVSSVIANGDITVYASWSDAIPPVISFTGSKLNQEENDDGYMHGSLDVYVHIEDANDGTETTQWYYVADNNKIERLDDSEWIPLTATKLGEDGTYVITIEGTQFPYGYVYIKAKDKDGNFSYMISDQYKVDNQAPFILHKPEGRREETFSVVCSDNDYPTIDVTVEDNHRVKTVTINGMDVTNGSNLPVGVTTSVVDGVRHYYLAKPGKLDATEYTEDKEPIIPEFKVYTISASDEAGNTATRLMNVYVTHEWNKDSNGDYIIEPAEEPTAEKPGLLPHVNCKHCARYILVNKNDTWTKIDKTNPSQLAEVQLPIGCVLVKNDIDIFYGALSINEALTKARDKYNNDGTPQNPIGKATIIKLTPNSVGAKVDATDLNNATLVNPKRSLILDLNGQSIDKDGVAYTSVTGNSNVTILLNDANNRKELSINGLTDELPYTNKSTVTGSPVMYVRHFSNTQKDKWQSLYLPFKLPSENSDYSLAAAKSVTTDKEGNSSEIRIRVLENENIDEYSPRFIKSTVNELTLYAENNILHPLQTKTEQIDANFSFKASFDSSIVSIEGSEFWVVNNSGYFGWANAGQHQRPYRWVILPTSQIGAKIRNLTLTISDEADGIESLEFSHTNNNDIFTLDGRKVQENTILMPGIYIQNGKKILVR